MPRMGTFAASLQFRDDLALIVKKIVNQLRPPTRYGVVAGTPGTEIAPTVTDVPVLQTGDTDAISIRTPGVKPFHTGARVRVRGEPNDRYVDEVVTPSEAQQLFGRVVTPEVQAAGTTLLLDADTVAFSGKTTGLITTSGAFSFASGVTATTVPPRAYRFLDSLVMLNGQVLMPSALTTTQATIGTLPIGYRPANDLIVPVSAGVAGSAMATVNLAIAATGAMKVNLPSGLTGTVTIQTVHLEGVIFLGG